MPTNPFAKYQIPAVSLLIFLVITLFFSLLGSAYALYPEEFDFAYTNISRLGRPSRNPEGWWLADAAFFQGGFLLLVFYYYLKQIRTTDENLNRAIELARLLGVVSCFGLMSLALFNSDYMIIHKIFGGIYFSSDFCLMLVAGFLALNHPKVPKALLLLALFSAALDAIFLGSGGKMSWAEWLTVISSFAVLAWIGILWNQLLQVAVQESSEKESI